MNKKPRFFITDVFCERKYSGNQLATFLNCDLLLEGEKQQIAREINFSETTFILSSEQKTAAYDVRIFTPEREIDFAGHPTLGTAFIIQQNIIRRPVEQVVLNLKVGQIPVWFSDQEEGKLWMDQMGPTFGDVFSADAMSDVLNLPEEAIDTRFPVEEVSTGLAHIIVPLKSLEFLKAAVIGKDRYFELIKKSRAKCILVFCPDRYTESHDMSVRMFADYFGVPEDPATGSGNGCLAGYLVKHRYFQSNEIDIKVGQGYEIGRPSLLCLRAKEEGGHIRIAVGGRVVPVAEGHWG